MKTEAVETKDQDNKNLSKIETLIKNKKERISITGRLDCTFAFTLRRIRKAVPTVTSNLVDAKSTWGYRSFKMYETDLNSNNYHTNYKDYIEYNTSTKLVNTSGRSVILWPTNPYNKKTVKTGTLFPDPQNFSWNTSTPSRMIRNQSLSIMSDYMSSIMATYTRLFNYSSTKRPFFQVDTINADRRESGRMIVSSKIGRRQLSTRDSKIVAKFKEKEAKNTSSK